MTLKESIRILKHAKRCNVLCVSSIKGGVAKTTTTAILGWLLAKSGFKILLVDGDAQGNLTECLTDTPLRDYRMKGEGGILQAIIKGDPDPYIKTIDKNLDILIGDDLFGTFPDHIYTTFSSRNKNFIIKENLIDKLRDRYDIILIDTAPTLTTALVNFLVASDYIFSLFEASRFCYSALFTLDDTIYEIKDKKVNKSLENIGILASMIDARRTDNKEYIELIKNHEDFGELCFDKVIMRRAATGRLSTYGLVGNPEIAEAVVQFKPIVSELLSRIAQRIQQ